MGRTTRGRQAGERPCRSPADPLSLLQPHQILQNNVRATVFRYASFQPSPPAPALVPRLPTILPAPVEPFFFHSTLFSSRRPSTTHGRLTDDGLRSLRCLERLVTGWGATGDLSDEIEPAGQRVCTAQRLPSRLSTLPPAPAQPLRSTLALRLTPLPHPPVTLPPTQPSQHPRILPAITTLYTPRLQLTNPTLASNRQLTPLLPTNRMGRPRRQRRRGSPPLSVAPRRGQEEQESQPHEG